MCIFKHTQIQPSQRKRENCEERLDSTMLQTEKVVTMEKVSFQYAMKIFLLCNMNAPLPKVIVTTLC